MYAVYIMIRNISIQFDFFSMQSLNDLIYDKIDNVASLVSIGANSFLNVKNWVVYLSVVIVYIQNILLNDMINGLC